METDRLVLVCENCNEPLKFDIIELKATGKRISVVPCECQYWSGHTDGREFEHNFLIESGEIAD
mgnify:CR=1 FL=1